MSGKLWPLITALLVAASLVAEAQTSAPAAGTNAVSRAGVLQLFDGSILHGSLDTMSPSNGLRWDFPAAEKPLRFTPTNLASVRFDTTAGAVAGARPNSRFKFKNGDDIFGDLAQVTDSQVALQTWFGSDLKAAREALHSIVFSRKGFATLYEGPTSAEGWKMGNTPRPWIYRDGVFVAQSADALGRDVGLKGSSRVEFDLAWVGSLSMSVTLYTENVSRFDYGSSSYMFYLGPGSLSLQRVQAGAGVMLLGQAQIPAMFKKNKMRLELRCNTEEGTIAAYADGQLLQKWKDQNGFVAKGTGLVFFSQMDGPSVKVSNIKVSEWDGRFENEGVTETKDDVLYLANRDKVVGNLMGVADGKVKFKASDTELQIPLERVTQIVFAPGATNQAPTAPWEVRAHFSAGETVALNLEHWDGKQFLGKSRNFGQVSFKPEAVREIHFNLDRHRLAESGSAPVDEFLELE
ncbi:MAG TPA: hypothetical protein VEH27_10030 [Methylomirabilota bacterium]|nr:hypothetical protein [Methylomirabilota bacterium]